MATYASLTDKEKKNLALYDTFQRSVVSSLMHIAANTDAETWNQFATDNVDPVVQSLDAGEIIPNNTDLAGSQDMTKEEYQGLQTFLRTLLASAGTNRPLLVKAAGVNAG